MSKWRLAHINDVHAAAFERDDQYSLFKLVIWRTAKGMGAHPLRYEQGVPQDRLEDIHASAVAYVALTGSVEGFPIVELEEPNSDY